MASTFYDSQLTAEEIEAALEAIDGVIVPANNGKVLAIENGSIVAKSVTEYTDTSVLVSKTVTENGTYDPADDNADGYSTVTVNVSGGGVTPVAITPVNYPSSYLNSGDARLIINDTRTPKYSFIAIDMSLYAGKIITIKNTGNRNFFGFYSAVSDGTAQQIFTTRQSTNGTLSVSVDTYYPRNTAYRYLCYDYTSNNQSQGIPSVTVVNASDLVP